MQPQQQNFSSPLTIIAIFAAIIEASALASLPFLEEDSQAIYTWFLVGFPPFLTLLFFITLNFNYKALYSPSDYHSDQDFLRAMSPAALQVPTPSPPSDSAAAFVVIATTHSRNKIETSLSECLASLETPHELTYNIMSWNPHTLKMDDLVRTTTD